MKVTANLTLERQDFFSSKDALRYRHQIRKLLQGVNSGLKRHRPFLLVGPPYPPKMTLPIALLGGIALTRHPSRISTRNL